MGGGLGNLGNRNGPTGPELSADSDTVLCFPSADTFELEFNGLSPVQTFSQLGCTVHSTIARLASFYYPLFFNYLRNVREGQTQTL